MERFPRTLCNLNLCKRCTCFVQFRRSLHQFFTERPKTIAASSSHSPPLPLCFTTCFKLNLSFNTTLSLTGIVRRASHVHARYLWVHTHKNREQIGLKPLSQQLLQIKLPVLLKRLATDSTNSKNKPDGTVPVPLWARLLIVSCVGGAMYYMFRSAVNEKALDNEELRYKEFDKIQLGGDWKLTDHNGNQRSSTDFRGQWIIMYMGFTHCPDICPEEMEKLGQIVKSFDDNPKMPPLQPLFITLDPERDTPTVIKDYLREFPSPRILGFTGTEDEIREVAKKFRAYFGKGPKDEDNDYIVDHTIIIYLISPKGDFVNYYGRNRTANEVIQSVTKHIEKYNELVKLEKI
ncbi:unnamed protein product [Lymnaea stagnalis]|uniref:Thioredoxin domain-containing protein n=1 Tax=Lymnaea stagnalis TaxID=6523 RepID=A0AAV2HCE9_LYMST